MRNPQIRNFWAERGGTRPFLHGACCHPKVATDSFLKALQDPINDLDIVPIEAGIDQFSKTASGSDCELETTPTSSSSSSKGAALAMSLGWKRASSGDVCRTYVATTAEVWSQATDDERTLLSGGDWRERHLQRSLHQPCALFDLRMPLKDRARKEYQCDSDVGPLDDGLSQHEDEDRGAAGKVGGV